MSAYPLLRSRCALLGSLAAAIVLGAAGCSFDDSRLIPCHRSSDCPGSLPRCTDGYCLPGPDDLGPKGADAEPDAAPADAGPSDLGPAPRAALAPPPPALLGDAVTLDASASTGTELRFTWKVEDPRGQLTEPRVEPGSDGARVRFRPLRPGTWRVLLTVTDEAGRSSSVEPLLLAVPGFRFYPWTGVRDLEPDAEGRVWVATDRGAFRLDPISGTWRELSREACGPVALGPHHAWFGLRGSPHEGLLRVPLPAAAGEPPGAAEVLPLPALNRVRCLSVRDDGELWAGGLLGVWRIPPDPPAATGVRLDPPGARDEVLALLHRPGGTWLGRSDGLCFLAAGSEDRCTPEPLPVLRDRLGAPLDPAILDLAWDEPRERLLIATDGKGLHLMQGGSVVPFQAAGSSAGLAGRLGRVALEPALGEAWIAGGQDLYRITADDEVLFIPVPRDQEELGEVRSLRRVATPARGLWVAGSDGVAWTGLE